MEDKLSAVHHGDCITGMKTLPRGQIDLVFADPPFNIGYEYDEYDDAKDRNHYLKWSHDWLAEVFRVLKPSGTFWLAIGDDYAAELKLAGQEVGFHCRSWVIWYYTFGVNCSRKFSRSHTHLFHFVKDPKEFTFREDALENRIPSARQLVYADTRANPRGRLPDDTWILRPQDLSDRFTASEDTWYFPRVAGTFKERAGFHGCQMPEQLLARIIRACSSENDLVLDPFSGSATTLVVAKKLGRRFLGFELSEDYVLRGSERLSRTSVGDRLEGDPEPRMSAPATPNVQPAHRKMQPKRVKVHFERPEDSASGLQRAVEKGLVEAFGHAHDGYSLDRVIIDPVLNLRFIEKCRALGLEGDARSWNHRLLHLRKSGALAGFTCSRRTEIPWNACDPYWFASEMAQRWMWDHRRASLDEIFCDPLLGAEFDHLAQCHVSGFSALELRWAALKMRKEIRDALPRAAILAPLQLRPPMALHESALEAIPPSAGVYALIADDQMLYAGCSLDLHVRLKMHLLDSQFQGQLAQQSTNSVQFSLLDPRMSLLLAYRGALVRERTPLLNVIGDNQGEDDRWDLEGAESDRVVMRQIEFDFKDAEPENLLRGS